jgi:hypothetical protein
MYVDTALIKIRRIVRNVDRVGSSFTPTFVGRNLVNSTLGNNTGHRFGSGEHMLKISNRSLFKDGLRN